MSVIRFIPHGSYDFRGYDKLEVSKGSYPMRWSCCCHYQLWKKARPVAKKRFSLNRTWRTGMELKADALKLRTCALAAIGSLSLDIDSLITDLLLCAPIEGKQFGLTSEVWHLLVEPKCPYFARSADQAKLVGPKILEAVEEMVTQITGDLGKPSGQLPKRRGNMLGIKHPSREVQQDNANRRPGPYVHLVSETSICDGFWPEDPRKYHKTTEAFRFVLNVLRFWPCAICICHHGRAESAWTWAPVDLQGPECSQSLPFRLWHSYMFDHVRIVHSGGRTCQGARYMPESKEEGPNFKLANSISFRMNYAQKKSTRSSFLQSFRELHFASILCPPRFSMLQRCCIGIDVFDFFNIPFGSFGNNLYSMVWARYSHKQFLNTWIHRSYKPKRWVYRLSWRLEDSWNSMGVMKNRDPWSRICLQRDCCSAGGAHQFCSGNFCMFMWPYPRPIILKRPACHSVHDERGLAKQTTS